MLPRMIGGRVTGRPQQVHVATLGSVASGPVSKNKNCFAALHVPVDVRGRSLIIFKEGGFNQPKDEQIHPLLNYASLDSLSKARKYTTLPSFQNLPPLLWSGGTGSLLCNEVT
uniref:ETF-QO n=1 Tax=Steinernema glaseri TaxID=37863 RepID=A0A1I7ZHQ4_9BILA